MPFLLCCTQQIVKYEYEEQNQPSSDIIDFGDDQNDTIDQFQDCHEFTHQINQINRNYTIYFDDNFNENDDYFQSNVATRMFKKCVSKTFLRDST